MTTTFNIETPADYLNLARRTAKRFYTKELDMVHAALGLSSECGELAEAWMRCEPTATEEQALAFHKELGDLFWFLAYAIETHIEPGSSESCSWADSWLVWGYTHPADYDEGPWSYGTVSGYRPMCSLVPPGSYRAGHYFHDNNLRLSAAVANYTTLVKKQVVYGAIQDNNAFLVTLADVARCLCRLTGGLGLEIPAILKLNIEKLQQRYPDKYSDELAITRLDEKNQ